MVDPEYKLTYFNYRGVAEPIRFIFKLAKVPFEDKRIEWDDEWDTKLKKEYPWGHLPVLDVGDFRLGQSISIARFLAKRFGLAGADEFQEAKCNELVDALNELRQDWTERFLEVDAEKKLSLEKKFGGKFHEYLKKFSNQLKKNGGKWLVGKSVTWADIYFAYFFGMLQDGMESMSEVVNSFPDLQIHQTNVYKIPEVYEWIENRPPEDF